MDDKPFRLTASATVRNNGMDATITPDAMDFASPLDAIEAVREWALDGFWPAKKAPLSITISIKDNRHG